MSNIMVSDRRGGLYRIIIEFTYGECDRLPFNILRRINAKIEFIPEAGIKATAEFNIRNAGESALFLEALDLFGENGSYVHGSPSEPSMLAQTTPAKTPLKAAAVSPVVEDDDLELETEG